MLQSACRHKMPTYVGNSMCGHLFQHINMSTYMSASEYVGIFANTRKNVLTYMSACFSILVICADISMCWHMSTSWCVDIYVGFWTCQHICQHKNKCVDIYVGIFLTTSRMCRHLNVLAYMSASWCVDINVGIRTCQHIGKHKNKCVDIYAGIFVLMLANMLTWPDADRYADTSRCWLIYICQHVEMSARSIMPTYSDADIYANILSWWHKCRQIEMRTYSSSSGEYADTYFNTHNFRILTNMHTYADADIYANILRCWHMPTYVGIMCRHLDCDSCCNMGSANHKPRFIHGGHRMHKGHGVRLSHYLVISWLQNQMTRQPHRHGPTHMKHYQWLAERILNLLEG